MARIVGNDVSKFQGVIDWETYKRNTNFAILKATEGVGYLDPQFIRNQSEGRRVGVPLGFYHFARPDLVNTPSQEADWFLEKIGALTEGEILALDYEPAVRVQAHVDWCKAWLEYVFKKTGVRPLIYMSESVIAQLNWQMVVDGGYGLWIAKYAEPRSPDAQFNDGEWPFTAMYQWTSEQRVQGIGGGLVNVDGNVFYGDIATFKKYGYKPVAPPTDYKTLYEKSQAELTEANKQLAAARAEIDRQSGILQKIKGDANTILSRIG